MIFVAEYCLVSCEVGTKLQTHCHLPLIRRFALFLLLCYAFAQRASKEHTGTIVFSVRPSVQPRPYVFPRVCELFKNGYNINVLLQPEGGDSMFSPEMTVLFTNPYDVISQNNNIDIFIAMIMFPHVLQGIAIK